MDSSAAGVASWTLTANASLLRGGESISPMLAVEAMAQAALLVLPQDGAPGGTPAPGAGGGATGAPRPVQGLLAGLDSIVFHAPLVAGDALAGRAALVGRFGRLAKARVWLERDGAVVAEGELLLALES